MKTMQGLMVAGAMGVLGSTAMGAAYTVPVDILRHYDNSGVQITGVVQQLIQGSATSISVQQDQGPPNPPFILDGGKYSFQYVDNPNQTADAGVTVRVTMDRSYTIQSFMTTVDANHHPATYEILGSTTGFGSLTSLVANTSMTGVNGLKFGYPYQWADQRPQFLEYRFRGNTGSFAAIDELQALVAPGQVDSDQGFNLMQLPGVSISNDGGAGWDGSTDGDTFVRMFNGLQDDNDRVRPHGGGDSRMLVNLGSQYLMNHISLGMSNSRQWSGGGRIEVSPDGINWTTVREQLSGNFGGDPNITFRMRLVQFVRITAINGNSNDNGLVEIQAFGLIPEPASTALLGIGALSIARRRR